MCELFKAELVTDVSYKDFDGRTHTERAGTVVCILQLRSKGLFSTDTHGRLVQEREDALIARLGRIHFDISPTQFRQVH
jgi:hypothetical protein